MRLRTDFDRVREQVRLQMGAAMAPRIGAADIPHSLARIAALEKACYDRAVGVIAQEKGSKFWASSPEFRQHYSATCYRVLAALEERDVAPHEVALSAHELAPAATAPFEAEARARLEAKVNFKTSTLNRCPRKGCGSNVVECKSIQTSAADEINRMSFKCMKCGHSW